MENIFVSDHLERTAQETPDKTALVYGEKKITYDEFLANSRKLAKYFLDLGVKRGDRIAVLMPNCPEYLYTYMASSMVGAILVGVSTRYKGPEIANILNNSQPLVLVMIDEHRGLNYQKIIREHLFPGVIPHTVVHETQGKKKLLLRKAERFQHLLQGEEISDEELKKRKQHLSPDDGALVIYTSGTIGKPKGAVLTHRNITTSMMIEARKWEFTGEDRILLHLPMSHIGGATETSIPGIIAGSTLVIMDHFHPAEALKVIADERVTFLGQVPTMYAMMFSVPEFDSYDLSSVRACAVAGAPTPPELMEKLFDIGQGVVRTGYGLAETAGLITYTSVEDPKEKILHTVGKPPPEYMLKIVDDERQELPQGEIGEVAVKGDCVLKEYFDNPAETEAVIDSEGWFYTGDLGLFDKEGYLELKGRKKDIIITGGFSVYPQEVEEKLVKHPMIQQAAVCGVPDPVMGETGRAFIVPLEGNTLKQSEIREHLEKYLADFKIPRQYVFRDSLPLTPTGKIEKRFLKESIADEG